MCTGTKINKLTPAAGFKRVFPWWMSTCDLISCRLGDQAGTSHLRTGGSVPVLRGDGQPQGHALRAGSGRRRLPARLRAGGPRLPHGNRASPPPSTSPSRPCTTISVSTMPCLPLERCTQRPSWTNEWTVCFRTLHGKETQLSCAF